MPIMPSFTRSKSGELTARYRARVHRDFLYWLPPANSFDAHEIVDRIWLGSVRAAFDKSSLEANHITFALTVAEDMVEFGQPASHDDDITEEEQEQKTTNQTTLVEPSWFTHHAVLGVYDNPSEFILEFLDQALEFIDHCLAHEKGAILIHCAAGVSRSVTVVVAFLMTRRNMTMAEALEHVKKIRPVAYPNRGFLAQLQELERHQGDVRKAKEAFELRKQTEANLYTLADII